MRANLPKQSPPTTETEASHPPSLELGGVYLQAMQDISTCLMEKLPAEDSLWQTLAQAESLLIGAQVNQMSLHDVFGAGGVAAFCQSIVDEYNRDHPGERHAVPAAADPSLRESYGQNEPRGGINYRRKRRATALLIAGFSLFFAILALWYTGLLAYLTKGSAYYLDELYHFTSTSTAVSAEPLTFTVPLTPATGINRILYTDADAHTLTLTHVRYDKKLLAVEDSASSSLNDNQGQVYRETYVWCVRIRYPVDVGYTEVHYVEPGYNGTATLTLPNGEVITSPIVPHDSGADGRGYEYIEFEVATLPASTPTDGAILSVTLDPPNAVTWTRISVGPRS